MTRVVEKGALQWVFVDCVSRQGEGALSTSDTPGFVADTQLAKQMAEIGVILLMFSVGMHFHPQELQSEAERAWLREFGVAYVADVYDEMSDSLVRAVRRML